MNHKLLLSTLILTFGAVARICASNICPITANANSDCGYIVNIGSGDALTGTIVPGALPYDGNDDSLIGVTNNSGADFTGSFTLIGSGDIFAFDGDGICTFIANTPAGAYCTAAQAAGLDPGDYQGPLNTFSNISTTNVFDDTGTINIVGLASGATTFFSLEGAPNQLGIMVGTPEPSTWALLAAGVGILVWCARRRREVRHG